MQILQQALGPEGITTYVMPSELIRRLAASMGMDIIGLVKTEEQLAAEQQAQQQMAMAQQAMAAGMADPQKLANAAATTQEMAAPTPDSLPTEQPA
jgi:pyruvate/2-oxoglutarate dehydrogenase complex dihydrolipoamide acyltransferase (E2) component